MQEVSESLLSFRHFMNDTEKLLRNSYKTKGFFAKAFLSITVCLSVDFLFVNLLFSVTKLENMCVLGGRIEL